MLPIQAAAMMAPDEKGWCRHLREGSEGRYECDIYEDRPDLCRVKQMAELYSHATGMPAGAYYKTAQQACRLLRKESGHEPLPNI